MKTVFAAVLIAMLAPFTAQAQEADLKTAQTMVRCSVIMEDAARMSDQDDKDFAEQSRNASAAYQMAAVAYTPGEDRQANALIASWTEQSEKDLRTMDDSTFEKHIKQCEEIQPKVRAVVQAFHDGIARNR